MENLLPADTKLDIFSRLSAVSVLQCRQVCKSWRKLLHHPHFAHLHLRRLLQLDKVGILYMYRSNDYYADCFYYGEYDENDNDEQSCTTLTKINHPPVNVGDEMVLSCNGLIGFPTSKYVLKDSFYICNPITREYINLPVFNTDIEDKKHFRLRVVYGFGYLPSTNEYKVVGIIYRRIRKETPHFKWVGSIKVYTLGAGTGWRKKGETDLHSYYCMPANGALYFLEDKELKIWAFDLANEEFRLLPSPPCFVRGPNDFFFLRVMRGLLCLVHEEYEESINIWCLKKNNCTNYVTKAQENQSWSWHNEVDMNCTTWEGRGTYDYEVFSFTRKGDVLLWLNVGNFSDDNENNKHSILSHYDRKTATLKYLSTEMLFYEVVPHMNSFVSLKALGEDAKIIGSGEG